MSHRYTLDNLYKCRDNCNNSGISKKSDLENCYDECKNNPVKDNHRDNSNNILFNNDFDRHRRVMSTKDKLLRKYLRRDINSTKDNFLHNDFGRRRGIGVMSTEEKCQQLCDDNPGGGPGYTAGKNCVPDCVKKYSSK